MKNAKDGLKCRRCGYTVQSVSYLKKFKVDPASSVFVINSSDQRSVTVSYSCPKCAHHEVFRWISEVSGEHAGVNTERVVEHFKCSRCSFTWSKVA